MKSFLLLVIATLVLGLAGCSSPARLVGDIHLGDTPEIVDAALGRPNRTLERAGTGERETVWIYTNIRTQRPAATGWSEVLVPGVSDQNDKVIQQPVTREVYRHEGKQHMHVVFTNARVSYVEYLRK